MCNMFEYCISLTNIDLSNLNTLNVKSMNNMFEGCGFLTNLDLSNFNTENVIDMGNMFKLFFISNFKFIKI